MERRGRRRRAGGRGIDWGVWGGAGETEEQSSAAIVCSQRSPHLFVTPLLPLSGSAAFQMLMV